MDKFHSKISEISVVDMEDLDMVRCVIINNEYHLTPPSQTIYQGRSNRTSNWSFVMSQNLLK